MKRIWFTQQKPYDYVPLRWGLGYLRDDDGADEGTSSLDRELLQHNFMCADGSVKVYPKSYTTRTRKMSGEYYVVEGSRFKATPVEPRIEFQVLRVQELNLKTVELDGSPLLFANTFAEFDLGYRGATFDQLRDELLKLNPKATIDTPFYVNKLTPMEGD